MKSSSIGFLFYAIAGSVLYTLNVKAQQIRGTPGVDYPNHHMIPKTSFKCSEQKYIPGFYADLETDCQVFHFCYNLRQESFLCPTGTTFNQPILACDSWYSSNCSLAPLFYSVNTGSENSGRTIPMLLKMRDRAKNSPSTSTEAVFDKISSLYESNTQIETKVKDANSEIPASEVLMKVSTDIKNKEQDSIKWSKGLVKNANQNAKNSSQLEEKLVEQPDIENKDYQEHLKDKSSSEINKNTLEELKFLSELYQGQNEDSYDAVTDGYYIDDYDSGFHEDVQREEEQDRKAKSSSNINESTLDEFKFLPELYKGETEADLFYDPVTEGYYMDDYNRGFSEEVQWDKQDVEDKSSSEINESTLEELKFLEELYQRQTEPDLVYDPITEGYYMDDYESSKTEWQQDSDSIDKFQNFYRNSAEFDDQLQDERESVQFQENYIGEQFGKTEDYLEVQTENLPEDIIFVEDNERRSDSLEEMTEFSKRILQTGQKSKRSKRKPMYIVIEDEPEIERPTEQSPDLYPVDKLVESLEFVSLDQLTGSNVELPIESEIEKNKTNKNSEENVDGGSNEKSTDMENSFAEDYQTSMPLANFHNLEISDSGEGDYENENSEVEQRILEDEQFSSNKYEEGETDYNDNFAYSDMTQEGYQSDISFENKGSNELEETYPDVVYDKDEEVGFKSEAYSELLPRDYDERFGYRSENYPYYENDYMLKTPYKFDDNVGYEENESELDGYQSDHFEYEENYSSEPTTEVDPSLKLGLYESDDTGFSAVNVREQNSPELITEENVEESFVVIPDETDSEYISADEVSHSQSFDGETGYNLGSDALPESLDYVYSEMDESQYSTSSQDGYDVIGGEQTEDAGSENASYDEAYGSSNEVQSNFEPIYEEMDSRFQPEEYNYVSDIETHEVPESYYQYMAQNQEFPSSSYEDLNKIEYSENPASSRLDFQEGLPLSNYGFPRNLFSAGIGDDGSYGYSYVQSDKQPDYINDYSYKTQFGYENEDNVLLNDEMENQSTISAAPGVEYADFDQTTSSNIDADQEFSMESETDPWNSLKYIKYSDDTESKPADEYLQFEKEVNNYTNSSADKISKISTDSEVIDSNLSVLEDAVNEFGLKIDQNKQNEETYFVFDSDEDTDGQASEVIDDISSYELLQTNDDVSESAEQTSEQIESKELSDNVDERDLVPIGGGNRSNEETAAVDISFKDIPVQMKSSFPTVDKYLSSSMSMTEVADSLDDKGKIFHAEPEVNDRTSSGMSSKQIIEAWSPNTRSIDLANKNPVTQFTLEQSAGLKPVTTPSSKKDFKAPTETEFLNNMAFQNSMNLEPFGFGSNMAQQFGTVGSSNSNPFSKMENSFSSQAEESEKSRLSKLSLLQDKVRSMKQGKFGMFKKYMNSMKKE